MDAVRTVVNENYSFSEQIKLKYFWFFVIMSSFAKN